MQRGDSISPWRIWIIAIQAALLTILSGWFTRPADAYPRPPAAVVKAIRKHFGPHHFRDALEVSWCESRFSVNAKNGQYLGLFQMGDWERETFGHGRTAMIQARAAATYFRHAGSDWSPWSCKPW